MAVRTVTEFKALYGNSGTLFPDNTTAEISEADVRAFGEDIADSFLNGSSSTSAWRDCGDVDLSSNLFPTTGGTGAGGAIQKNNTFDVTVEGTPAGMAEPILVGCTIRALANAPGQTLANWRIYW